jgi:broad specificity phosphatase PhoE
MTRALPIAMSLLLIAACASHGVGERDRAADGTHFVLVRHAEKASDDPKDPSLSDVGRLRAERLADALAHAPLAAAYATAYRRTQSTAAPSAARHGVAVTTYDASRPAAEFAAELRRSHRDRTVLVVGHSNTVPALAAALCGCAVAPMRDDEFDRRIDIWIDARAGGDSIARMEERRY